MEMAFPLLNFSSIRTEAEVSVEVDVPVPRGHCEIHYLPVKQPANLLNQRWFFLNQSFIATYLLGWGWFAVAAINNLSKSSGSHSEMAHLVLKYPTQSRPAHENIWGIAGSAFWRSDLLIFSALQHQVTVILWHWC